MATTNAATLQAFLDAFNAHDVDAIMSFFTDDCVLDMPRGPGPWGPASDRQTAGPGRDPVEIRRDPGHPIRR